MSTSDFSASLLVDQTPEEVFNAINNVQEWWTNDVTGNTQKLNDEFTVHFEAIHVSTQKVVEVIPGRKVVWLVTDSSLNFLKNKSEWTGTEISFEISNHDTKTHINFTHLGLVPQAECYQACSQGWDYFIKGSLFRFISEGKGTPGL
jgi:hypothetical protein